MHSYIIPPRLPHDMCSYVIMSCVISPIFGYNSYRYDIGNVQPRLALSWRWLAIVSDSSIVATTTTATATVSCGPWNVLTFHGTSCIMYHCNTLFSACTDTGITHVMSCKSYLHFLLSIPAQLFDLIMVSMAKNSLFCADCALMRPYL